MKKSFLILLILVAVTVVMLGGCNGNTDKSESTTADGETQTISETQSDTEEATDMQTMAETNIETVTEAETTAEVIGKIEFAPIDDVVYPYLDAVREYLEAGADADINNFDYHQTNQAKSIDLSWTLTGTSAKSYTLEVATKSDYSDAAKITVSGSKTTYSLKNLLRDTNYFIRISVLDNESVYAETTFKTVYLGPRFLDVGGLYNNCRDLGGYKVGDKAVLSNMVFRGSSPDNCSSATSNTLTKEGKTFFNETVKIKTQLDLRGSSENCGRTNSTFKYANYVHVPLTAYGEELLRHRRQSCMHRHSDFLQTPKTIRFTSTVPEVPTEPERLRQYFWHIWVLTRARLFRITL